jgi:hypothetical protein
MISFEKAKTIISKWLEVTTDDLCEICAVDDKPYGWVFYYALKNYDPNDTSTSLAGNAPLIFDRMDGEIRVTGTAHEVEYYLKEYEASLPKARLSMQPEPSNFTNRYS